ncbi:MAG TPA: ABC transporter substrate-binding protein [Candidatus Saccharimonadales bacterium]|nr:ABC transporter substrate-binding protein [Candidatus Saccharimonadales bacterium]
MAVIRKRLIFWLIKAYIKKSGKTILFSFIAGLIIFFAFLLIAKYYSHIVPFSRVETIGEVGAYTQDTLPSEITGKMSTGLTAVAINGAIKPGLASSWDILDHGKTYRFHLRKGVHFSDGQEVTSSTVNYNFSDVSEDKPDKYTIDFKLKDPYAPFLVTVSKPLFDRGFSGVGDYRLTKINISDGFIQSMSIISTKDSDQTINYEFYPTEEALKTAYLLGEVTEIEGIDANIIQSMNLQNFHNTTVTKVPNYSQLVTLFFNNDDNELSSKTLRVALMYAVPDTFKEGKSANTPYSPLSQYYNRDISQRKQDLPHAKLLLQPSSTSSLSGKVQTPKTLTIVTFPRYRPVAETIAKAWKNLGINTTIVDTDGVPSTYQVFLGDFNVPIDPDQYTLWHSEGPDNITHYKNLRIDDLLESGRKTVDVNQRKTIYDNFQKFLLEDAPAVFLYYPDEYTVDRN